jgi:hypothetical protein
VDDNLSKTGVDLQSLAIYPSVRTKVRGPFMHDPPISLSLFFACLCNVDMRRSDVRGSDVRDSWWRGLVGGGQLVVARELVAGNYLIWNSLGSAHGAYLPDVDLPPL